MRIWSCKIGQAANLPKGADLPMRNAVRDEYVKMTGVEPAFLFSGWGASLDEWEKTVVEGREVDAFALARPALATVARAIQLDAEYAQGWHREVEIAALRSGVSPAMADATATAFMQLRFNIQIEGPTRPDPHQPAK